MLVDEVEGVGCDVCVCCAGSAGGDGSELECGVDASDRGECAGAAECEARSGGPGVAAYGVENLLRVGECPPCVREGGGCLAVPASDARGGEPSDGADVACGG